MNIITNRNSTFGIIWEINSIREGYVFGKIQIIIGNEIYPKACPENYYTVSVVFANFKGSFTRKYYHGGSDGEDFGERKFSVKKYVYWKLKIFSA